MTPEARDHRAEPDREGAWGSQGDQPHRWYHLQGSEGFEAATTGLFDPFLTDRHGGQLLLRHGRIAAAGEQVRSGKQAATAH
jgi:hypothetical protein